MSRRLDVLRAIARLLRSAATGAEIYGVDDDAAEPTTVPAGGKIVVDAGDPGDPVIVLSPVTYHWTHRVPLLVVAAGDGGTSAEETVDAILFAIGDAIVADRTLAGLVDWLDAIAPETGDLLLDHAVSPRRADVVLLVSYATANPLG